MTSPLSSPSPQGLYDPQFEHDACGVGFIADIAGRRSHRIIEQGLQVLRNMEHRGACGADSSTGDGAGLLVQMPDAFLRKRAAEIGITLPRLGAYACGLVFLPRDAEARHAVERAIEKIVLEEGQSVLGWRDVPVDERELGAVAVSSRPVIQQIFIGASAAIEEALAQDALVFERTLYVIRRRLEQAAPALTGGNGQCYVPSLSSRTLIYKGMLSAAQLGSTYPDVTDPDFQSALVLVHQRFSTNTFPSWALAHPYRFIAHNGEINTLRGNANWMKAREALMASPLFGEKLRDLLPIIPPGGSDTAAFDNVLELLVLSGRSLPHAMLMMVPEPWSNDTGMAPELRAFYEYHSTVMEPWDGPACLTFTDGTMIGAMLDRNGLRPARYYVTRDGLLLLASEVGVLDVPSEDVVERGRVRPGRMLLVDTSRGRILSDEEIKTELAGAAPYRDWVGANLIDLDALPAPHAATPRPETPDTLRTRQLMFGYTQEDVRILLADMAENGEEPVGSMGSDTALAILSSRPRLLFDYFKQAFAQVTNPPLDAIRERLVTTMESTIGPEGNLLETRLGSRRRVRVPYPVIDDEQLARLRALDDPRLRAATLPILFEVSRGTAGLAEAIDRLTRMASAAVEGGCGVLVLSDRSAREERAAIPSLLATAAVHHHLVRTGLRARCGLVVETGDAREVHHCALLLGYGAGAVNPYLAIESVEAMVREGIPAGITREQAVRNYVQALNKGVLKVMSKMGISALRSYSGAQIFEAIGLNPSLIDAHFTGTPSRIGGLDVHGVARETLERHGRAYRAAKVDARLDAGGEYQWRRDGEVHLFSPETVFKLQHATRSGQFRIFKEYTRLVDDQARRAATLRGLLQLVPAAEPVPLEEVEPVESIVKRFATGAMSYGSISEEAHSTLARAMNSLNAKSNSGEGGEDPARYRDDPDGGSRRSAIKQVASGRFGVTSEYLVSADEIQIKMSQGAKPGEGGQLPGHKVYPWIAKVRHSTPGVGLISPPPHHDIYSIEDLAQLIYDLKCANPRARISVKLVALAGVGTVAAGVAKAGADAVLISGFDGGTGAAPLSSIKHAGVPWELGLAETQQVLRLNGLRNRITVQADGQMKTGRDVVIAALLGAEEFGFATAPLVVSGCVMMRVCHLHTCPVGIATQDPELRKRFTGDPEFVVNFFRFLAEEVREHMAALGFRTMDEMIGRVDCLAAPAPSPEAGWKLSEIDLSRILHDPEMPGAPPRRRTETQHHPATSVLDLELIFSSHTALRHRQPVRLESDVRNVNRAVGTMLGAEITRRWGGEGLPDDTIQIRFTGSAGQSFGAFIPRGLTLTLEGDANDHVGKGLSGGKIVVAPPDLKVGPTSTGAAGAAENVIVGNVVLYGATSGEAYIRGVAGERFAVRNSGASAVVEGVGDHGCEYMTGGCVVVLGPVGRNFAAGMSGGLAYVLDADGSFESRCNRAMVDLERIYDDEDAPDLRRLLSRHAEYTGSEVAMELLADWSAALRRFVRVVPREYKAALAATRAQEQAVSALAG